MRRDRLTFGMMLGMPLHAARALRLRDQLRSAGICPPPSCSPTTARTAARCCTRCATAPTSISCARWPPRPKGTTLLARGEVQFVVTIPENFSRDLLRGDRPASCSSRPTPPTPPRPATPSARSRTLLDTALAQRSQGPARASRRHARPGRAARPRPATTRRRSRSTTSCPA